MARRVCCCGRRAVHGIRRAAAAHGRSGSQKPHGPPAQHPSSKCRTARLHSGFPSPGPGQTRQTGWPQWTPLRGVRLQGQARGQRHPAFSATARHAAGMLVAPQLLLAQRCHHPHEDRHSLNVGAPYSWSPVLRASFSFTISNSASLLRNFPLMVWRDRRGSGDVCGGGASACGACDSSSCGCAGRLYTHTCRLRRRPAADSHRLGLRRCCCCILRGGRSGRCHLPCCQQQHLRMCGGGGRAQRTRWSVRNRHDTTARGCWATASVAGVVVH
jgi:hypothetical protein